MYFCSLPVTTLLNHPERKNINVQEKFWINIVSGSKLHGALRFSTIKIWLLRIFVWVNSSHKLGNGFFLNKCLENDHKSLKVSWCRKCFSYIYFVFTFSLVSTQWEKHWLINEVITSAQSGDAGDFLWSHWMPALYTGDWTNRINHRMIQSKRLLQVKCKYNWIRRTQKESNRPPDHLFCLSFISIRKSKCSSPDSVT